MESGFCQKKGGRGQLKKKYFIDDCFECVEWGKKLAVCLKTTED